MSFCPHCGKEGREGAIFCPSCGNKLIQLETPPPAPVKRHPTVIACAILLFISSLIHIINVVDFILICELVFSIGQLFFAIFALVAGLLLWKLKEIGGIVGLAYGIISIVLTLLLPLLEGFEYNVYGIAFDIFLNTAIIILIVVGWKHLKRS